MKSILITLAAAAVIFAQPYGPNPNSNPAGTCCNTAVEPLTEAETASILYMREEEKLARDVYTKLAEKWQLRLFTNIARSEQQHFNSVGVLIERYGLTDPALAAGVFTNPKLADLYAQLIEKGMLSLKDALEVGIAIETVDIEDLEAGLKSTTKTDLKTIYSNLLTASLQHLDSFQASHEVCIYQ